MSEAVTVWSMPNCMPCRAAKRMLTRQGIAFTEGDLTEAPEKAAEFRAAGFTSSPVIESDYAPTFSGFDPDRLNDLIDRARGWSYLEADA